MSPPPFYCWVDSNLHHLVIFAERGRQRLIQHLMVCMYYTAVLQNNLLGFTGIMRKFTLVTFICSLTACISYLFQLHLNTKWIEHAQHACPGLMQWFSIKRRTFSLIHHGILPNHISILTLEKQFPPQLLLLGLLPAELCEVSHHHLALFHQVLCEGRGVNAVDM